MLLPGIKLGPKDWLQKLNESQAQYVEIWYRVDKPEWYTEMFKELQRRGVTFGLHFWGVTSTSHEANVSYPGKDRLESIELMETCLKAASAWQATYVNIHSGNTHPMHLDLDDWCMTPDENFSTIGDAEAVVLRTSALTDLGRLAHECNTALLVELIPQATHNKNDRLDTVPEYPTSPAGLLDLCERRLIGFTNDFCHTFSLNPGQTRENLYNDFAKLTQAFAPHTYLCHINTLFEPYNGTDAHGGILPADFAKPGVFPTPNEYRQLLQQLGQLNHDVFLIGEPSSHHVENYLALKELVLSC